MKTVPLRLSRKSIERPVVFDVFFLDRERAIVALERYAVFVDDLRTMLTPVTKAVYDPARRSRKRSLEQRVDHDDLVTELELHDSSASRCKALRSGHQSGIAQFFLTW